MKVNKEMIEGIIETLLELVDDNTVPKNIKSKINEIINVLKKDNDESINISKALGMIEEISDDNNIQPYTRTQIWNIASALETAQL